MICRLAIVLALAIACLSVYLASHPADACCPASPKGEPVLNADQSVIIIWDAAKKRQHFIRRASFKIAADSFGFLIPSPTEPELDESGNDAFDRLGQLTAPEIRWETNTVKRHGTPKDAAAPRAKADYVKVLQETLVAGFNAAVLETNSTKALVKWLEDNGYYFSPEVEAWADPYVKDGWKITALKVAGTKNDFRNRSVSAGSLRMSFQTERPLFPYREPDSKSAADFLKPASRLLRIFFIAEARYRGELTQEQPWTGRVAWAGKIAAYSRTQVVGLLKLPDSSGPGDWYLTEFEDPWPYKVAPADLYFSRDPDQRDVRRTPVTHYRTDYVYEAETPLAEGGRSGKKDNDTPRWAQNPTFYVEGTLIGMVLVVGVVVLAIVRYRKAA